LEVGSYKSTHEATVKAFLISS